MCVQAAYRGCQLWCVRVRSMPLWIMGSWRFGCRFTDPLPTVLSKCWSWLKFFWQFLNSSEFQCIAHTNKMNFFYFNIRCVLRTKRGGVSKVWAYILRTGGGVRCNCNYSIRNTWMVHREPLRFNVDSACIDIVSPWIFCFVHNSLFDNLWSIPSLNNICCSVFHNHECPIYHIMICECIFERYSLCSCFLSICEHDLEKQLH